MTPLAPIEAADECRTRADCIRLAYVALRELSMISKTLDRVVMALERDAMIQAPTGEPPRDWTDDQRREAQEAMSEIRAMREPSTTYCKKCTGSIPTGKHCAGAECPLRSTK